MSKYQTRRQQRRSRIRNIIKRTFLIIILAAIAVVSTFYYVKHKNEKTAFFTKTGVKLKGQTAQVIKDSPKLLAENYPKAEVPIQTQKQDTFKSIEPVAQEVEQSSAELTNNTEFINPKPTTPEVMPVKKSFVDSAKQARPTAKVVKPVKLGLVDTAKLKPVVPPVEKVEMKELSQQKMSEILNNIESEKIKNKSRSNCIQIQKTNTSNVSNAFAIAKFLNSNGFIISGRLTIPGELEGIQIETVGSCIKLTIGRL